MAEPLSPAWLWYPGRPVPCGDTAILMGGGCHPGGNELMIALFLGRIGLRLCLTAGKNPSRLPGAP